MELRLFTVFALLVSVIPPVFAGSLRDARVTHAIGDVRIADASIAVHPAAAQEVIGAGLTVLLGSHSRAELLFADQTLTRLGGETALRIKPGSRDLLLDQGTLLVQVPRFHGGARVRAGPLTATVGGATFLIEHLPARSVKIVVLEGDLRLSVNGFLGDSIILTPGKLLITNPDVRRIPDPVDVDLRTLAETSSLINPKLFLGASGSALPSLPLIAQKIARQDRLVQSKKLFPTNLVIMGSGTRIVIPGAAATAQSPGPEREAAEVASKNATEVRNSTKIALERQAGELRREKVPLPEP